MIFSKVFQNKKILILGLGITGLNLYKALKKSSANVYVWDDNIKIKNIKNINLNKFKFKNLDFCVPSPGISTKGKEAHLIIKILKRNKIKIISELDLFQIYLNSQNNYNNGNIKIIAVTGTNGKSTVVSIIDHVLDRLKINRSLVGNIGKSIFESITLKNGYYIIEVSSYQLETTLLFKPNFSILTNISKDHLDRHKTMQEYIRQKFNIFKKQSLKDTAIVSVDYSGTQKFIKKLLTKDKLNVIKISGKNKNSIYYYDDYSIYKNKKILFKPSNYSLRGNHNLENITHVVALFESQGNLNTTSLRAINDFSGLSHRQEVVRKIKKTLFINDSKATNIESSVPALKSFKNIYWICGGITKSKDMRVAIPYLKNVKKIFIIGLEKKIFFDAFEEVAEIVYVKNMNSAVQISYLNAKKDNQHASIILSPAAASFDQYKNFETRGNAFKRIVSNL